MKRVLSIAMILALAAGFANNATAKSEKKNEPKRRDVEEILKPLGEKHYPEKIKVKSMSSIEIGDTYYHVYQGKLDTIGYHIIVFDNYLNYLGYYKCDYPPTNFEIEGCIVIDSNDVDEETGDQLYFTIPIDEEKGLPQKIVIGGMPTDFVKSPTYDEVTKKKAAGESTNGKTTEGEEGEEEKPVPEFRQWVIIFKGKPVEARAIFIRQEKNTVFLRLEATGKEKGFPLISLSKDDQEYVKQFK